MARKQHTADATPNPIGEARSILQVDVQASLAGAIGILDRLEDDVLYAHGLHHAVNLLRRATGAVERADDHLDKSELPRQATDGEVPS